MKTLILFLVLAASAYAGSEAKIQNDGYIAFFKLSKEPAFAEGAKQAESDFKKGVFRILIYGEPGPFFPSEIYLQKKYGVETQRIAGCVVSEGLVSGADGYNSTMQKLLNQKFDRDIFAEAKLKDK